ncbi:hypothetical protein MKW94_021997 [Papaver nudicaule]|uniref:Uncharacterized protein n=1 Tax=Papaver nudicaule TaxID=74823 RepID=A0AA41VGC0_PAPNU|nr:hypothetical protein [Papaver nudicaule]
MAELTRFTAAAFNSKASCIKTAPLGASLLNIITRYGERIFLKDFANIPNYPRKPKKTGPGPQPFSKTSRKKMQKKLAAAHSIRKPTTSADTTKEAKLIEGCGDVQEAKTIEDCADVQEVKLIESLGADLQEAKLIESLGADLQEAKLIESRRDLQGPAPGDSSLIMSCGDLRGYGGAKAVGAVMPQAKTARANVAISTPNCGGHSSSRDSVVCQLCDKPFHTASECYKRFKKGFKTKSHGDLQGPSSGNSPLAILTSSGEILRPTTSVGLTKEA